MWDLIVLVPDHCLSFYFSVRNDLAGKKSITADAKFGSYLTFSCIKV